MSELTKKYIPMLILSVIGLFLLFSYPLGIMTGVSTELGNWYMLLAAFGMIIGASNVIRIQVNEFMRGDIYKKVCSGALLATLLYVTGLGLVQGVDSEGYRYTYELLIAGGLLTFTALRAFFSFSAFYRIFKVRTIESAAMMIATLLALMISVPIAETFFPGLNVFTAFLQDTLQVGGMRAIYIIAGIALFMVTLRMIAGIDKNWMGSTE